MSLSAWQRYRTPLAAVILAASVAVLNGCATPAAGPTATELEHPTTGPGFTLVPVDERIIGILRKYSATSLGPRFQGKRYVASNVLRSGDAVAITVYETGGSSLFGAPPQMPGGAGQTAPAGAAGSAGITPPGVTTVPPQTIEADGTITMPYAGRIKAAGRTPGQLGQDIEQALQGKAIQPQVIVTLVNNAGNTATVGGEVASPRSVVLTLRGEKLLDVIAQAGGAKFPPYETYVRVIRDGVVGTVMLQTVLANPSENIVVRPNDQIFVIRNPRTFTVLGASQKVSQYTFDTERVTLAEAVARSGGPIDQVGDPNGIYVFRYEPWEVARAIWQVPPADLLVDGRVPEFVPILYKVTLRDAGGFFTAQRILVRDRDVVVITNADATQIQKTLALVRGFTGVAFDLSRGTSN